MNLRFIKSVVALILASSALVAQTGRNIIPVKQNIIENQSDKKFIFECGTESPDEKWEEEFQRLIAEQKLLNASGNKVQANYTIPIVFHIIHGGQAVGTYPNLSNAQIVSQIQVLNDDYAGVGLNSGNYPANAFTSYANAAALPAANKDGNGRVKIANFNITFCLAQIDKNGNQMAEPGIDRINYNSISTPTSSTYPSKNPAYSGYQNANQTFKPFIDNYIKANTVWDPAKYLNVWVTDINTPGLAGYATLPPNSTLNGLGAGPFGTATTDGFWCYAKCLGNTGTTMQNYDKGRVATHEIGHWLGMRHIWGDGACATDYCADTPPASAANTAVQAYNYPHKANSCTAPNGTSNTTPNGANGEMFMNFMDYTPHALMYMFTEDQRTRAQTAMVNSPLRKYLGTHGLCSVSLATPATAAYTMTNSACTSSVVSVNNTSSGSPTPTYTWSASPSAGVVFNPNANAANPTITFANAGTYVVTLSAQSGTTAVSTKTNNIVVSSCTSTTTPATAVFTMTNSACTSSVVSVNNTSTGSPTPTYTWSASPSAGVVFNPNANAANPTITFANAGTYVVTLSAKSGTTAVSTKTNNIVVSSCTPTTTPATAVFTMTNSACSSTGVSVNNTSTGSPTPTYTWSASPSAGVTFNPNVNVASPTITFANAGTYVVTLSAQSGTTAVSTKTNNIVISTCTLSPVCTKTVTNLGATDTVIVSAAGADAQTAGCSPRAGYVFGSNCYDDKEKAEFFQASTYANVSAPAFVTGAVVVFFKNGNMGTTGTASSPVNLKMYNGTAAAGPTGIVGIATAVANLGQITAVTATNNIGYLGGNPAVTYQSNVLLPYKYTFASPIPAPTGGFIMSVTTPTVAGDTAVVFNSKATTNTSWEMWSNNTWHDMGISWGFKSNLAIFPLFTCATSIATHNTLTNNINIMPNPSTGLFNILVTLPSAQDLTVSVTNMLGQTIYENGYKSFNNDVISLDLSNHNQGVYFVTVSNGTDKNVQRIILTK